MIPQYRTQRHQTSSIEVLEELAALYGESNANTIVPPYVSAAYYGVGLKLTSRPVIGQLIVITLASSVYDELSVGFPQYVPPIVSETSNAFTQFNLASVGYDQPANEYTPGGAKWGMQSSIWYRTVDNYDLIAWDAGKGYYGWVHNAPTGSAYQMMTVTQLSRGNYWTTPIAPSPSYHLTSTYGNSTVKPGTSSAMAAGTNSVNVDAGGFVIASCSRPDSNVAASVNNSFTLTTQERTTVLHPTRYFTARRTYETAATGQNTTFSFSESKMTATAIAAFNP